MTRDPLFFGLLRRREMVVPSLRGLLLLGILMAAAVWLFLRAVQPFLAVNRPVGGEVLVVEGWIPDYAMREALATFRSRPYKLMITTGGPMPQGMAFSALGTYAEFAAAAMKDFGLGRDSVAAVPSRDVGRDRTYQEGISLAEWLRAHPGAFTRMDLVSFSSHARRSRLLYRMALGPEVDVGVLAPRDIGYDPAAWWKTSNGVRRVSDEVIAYLYAKLIFRG
jgi:hypothetical protein